MAARRIRPKLTSAQTDAKYIAMGEKMMGAVTDDEEAGALEAANAGKFGRLYKYSDPKIKHLAFIRDATDAGLRRIQGMSNIIYGRDATPDHTTLCRRINSLGGDARHGTAVVCDYGRTLILTADSTGESMSDTNGWRHEKHGGKRGYLSYHTIAHEETGEFVVSKLTAPEDGDAPQFEGLIEDALRNSGIDPEKRREEVRRRRADLAAGKAVMLSRNDGIADASPEAAAKVAAAVERMLAGGDGGAGGARAAHEKGGEAKDRSGGAGGARAAHKKGGEAKDRSGGAGGARAAHKKGGEAKDRSGGAGGARAAHEKGRAAAKSAVMMSVMARRYAADMDEATVPILAAAAAPYNHPATGNSGQEARACATDEPSPAEPSPAEPSPAEPSPAEPSPAEPSPAEPSPAEPSPSDLAEAESATQARLAHAATAVSIAVSILDALGINPGWEDLGDDWINIIVRGDAAYDAHRIFKFCHELAIYPCIRIRRNANLRSRGVGKARPMAVIDQLGGGNSDPKTFYAASRDEKGLYQKAWKIIAGYARWLHEAAFGSFKSLLGGSIMAVKPDNMVAEMTRKTSLYNQLQAAGAEAVAVA